MIFIQLAFLAVILFIVYKIISRVTKPMEFVSQEQFVEFTPVLNTLPKRAMKNSHWFIHTFMRSRRKG